MNKLMTLLLVALASMALATAAGPDTTDTTPDGAPTDAADTMTGNTTPDDGTGTGKKPSDTGAAMNDTAKESPGKGAAAKGTAMPPEQAQEAVERIKERVGEKARARTQSLEGMGEAARKARQNQNRVRATVEALHQLGNVSGGIGEQVSEVAKEFNNSLKKTVEAEEQIHKKSGFARFFTGGAEKAAKDIQNQTETNQQRIQELKQLHGQCDCAEPVKEMLRKQIQELEQEQQRLRNIAQEERQKKGLLGWMWK